MRIHNLCTNLPTQLLRNYPSSATTYLNTPDEYEKPTRTSRVGPIQRSTNRLYKVELISKMKYLEDSTVVFSYLYTFQRSNGLMRLDNQRSNYLLSDI